MIEYNPFNIILYKREYDQIKIKLERTIIEKLYTDVLSESKFIDKQTNEPFEWTISKCMYTNNIEDKYIYLINITQIGSIEDIQFIYNKVNIHKLSKKIILTKETQPELYIKVYNFIEQYLNSMSEFKKLKELHNNIKLGIKFIKDTYQGNLLNLETDLYRHFYENADKIIMLDSKYYNDKNCVVPVINFDIIQFYDWIADKYSINKQNFKLDFIQAYMKCKMCLESNYTIITDSESILALENENYILKIKNYRRLYVNSYQPLYEVFITNKLTELVTKINYKQFDEDRKLDRFYSDMLEFIFDTIELIKSYDEIHNQSSINRQNLAICEQQHIDEMLLQCEKEILAKNEKEKMRIVYIKSFYEKIINIICDKNIPQKFQEINQNNHKSIFMLHNNKSDIIANDNQLLILANLQFILKNEE